MARRGDGLVLRGKTWWLDFTFRWIRHQSRLGMDIKPDRCPGARRVCPQELQRHLLSTS
jgi:hypothetical protein